jgi:HD-GYP domain-containing protein (c-di-GMP phosphodiesterase class II)
MLPTAALRELRRCSGSQFDPAVVVAFTTRVGFPHEVALAA